MANPSRLAAGQVIKISGKAPPRRRSRPVGVEAMPKPPAPTETETKSRDDVQAVFRRAREQESRGNLEAADATLDEGGAAVSRQRAAGQAATAVTALIRSLDREATQASQNLDLAIAQVDRVLQLDPANRKARLEAGTRARAHQEDEREVRRKRRARSASGAAAGRRPLAPAFGDRLQAPRSGVLHSGGASPASATVDS